MKPLQPLALMLLSNALLLTACGRTETHAALLRAPSPPTARHVELYMMGQMPTRPYDEVGIVQAIGTGTDADPENVIRALTHRWRELGCDAIVRVQVDVGYTRAHAVGVCVRWPPVAGGK